LIRNLILSFLTRGAVALINLGIFLSLTNALGSAVFGSVSVLILNIAIIHALAETYTGSALVYFIPRAKTGRLYLSGLLWIVGCVTVVATLLNLFNTATQIGILHLYSLSALISINGFHATLLLGFERLRKYQTVVFLSPALLLLLITALTPAYAGTIFLYISALYIASGITLIVSLIFVMPLLFNKASDNKTHSGLAILKNGLINQLGNLAHILSNRLSYYLLGAAVAVGVYAGATSLAESIWVISASISPLVLTRIANRTKQSQDANLTFILAKLSFLLSAAGILAIVLIPPDFFLMVVGKDFSGLKTLIMALSPGVLAISFSSIISHYYSGQGKQKVLLFANGAGLFVTVLCCWPLINHFGTLGACYTACLAYFTQAGVLLFIFMKDNQLPFNTLFYLRKDLSLLSVKNA
jgi:O-antigen/teichoic acid export membrane protein